MNSKTRSVIELSTSKDKITPMNDNGTICAIKMIPDDDQAISIQILEMKIDFVFMSFDIKEISDDKEIPPESVIDGNHKPISPMDPKYKPMRFDSRIGFEIIFKYKTKPQSNINIKLKIEATAYLELKSASDACPTFGYYTCAENLRCINEILACDNIDNCGDNSDERKCDQMSFLIIFSIITLMFTALFLFCYVLTKVVMSGSIATTKKSACKNFHTKIKISKYQNVIEESDVNNCCVDNNVKSDNLKSDSVKLEGVRSDYDDNNEFEISSTDPLIRK